MDTTDSRAGRLSHLRREWTPLRRKSGRDLSIRGRSVGLDHGEMRRSPRLSSALFVLRTDGAAHRAMVARARSSRQIVRADVTTWVGLGPHHTAAPSPSSGPLGR